MSFKTLRNNERGIAMLIAMLAVVLLAIIGLGFMFMSSSENSVNNNFKDSQKSYFASRAGLENVRLMLVPPDARTGLGAGPLYASAMALTMPTVTANTGVLYVENKRSGAENIDPTTASGASVALNPNLDNEICREQFPGLASFGATPLAGAPCDSTQAFPNVSTYFQVPPVVANQFSNTNGALPFKWVRLTNKQNLMGTLGAKIDAAQPNNAQVCWDGSTQRAIPPGTLCTLTPSPTTTSMMPVWILTSLSETPAVGSNPGSRRVTQMEVALSPPLAPPGAVAAQAPINVQGKLNVSGYDNCKCASPTTGGNRPNAVCNSKFAVYSGQPFCPGGTCGQGVTQTGNAATLSSGLGNGLTVYNTSTGALIGAQGATGQGSWPFDINQLVQTYANGAINAGTSPLYNFSCSAGTPYNSCGHQAGQTFGGFPSGLPDSPSWANLPPPQATYIPGSVQLTGNASGSGILIIDGDLDVHGGLAFYGLILVRGEIKFTGGGSQPVNVYGGVLAGEDVNASDVALTDTVGGSFSFQYDSCALKLMTSQQPPRLIATHEISF